jgi:hypothetical protein
MRFRARLVLGLYGVALAVPGVVMAGPLGDDESTVMQAPPQMQGEPHHHKGMFGRRHCVECQRARVKAQDGIDVPAPPPIDSGMQGQVMSSATHCPTCQGNMVVSGPAMSVSGPVMSQDSHAAGYAVVGGPGGPAGPEAPGYAVVGEVLVGSEPAPVGVAKMRNHGGADPRTAAMAARGGAGPVDPSVVPTSMPPAQVALSSPASDRPHIISHLFGLPKFGQLRREREDKERQKHASIAYGEVDGHVNELPASMVYGKDKH